MIFRVLSLKHGLQYFNTVWQEIFAGVYFCGLAIYCVLRELSFAIRTDWFFWLGINNNIFAILRKYLVPSIDNIFVVI